MGKPLINFKNWSTNDIRMLVIAHFVFVYPILSGSIFMVLFFFALPQNSKWVKGYWLIACGAWMLLLAVVLPLMGGKNEYHPTGTQRRPKKKTKEHGSSTETIPLAQDNIKVEVAKMDRINRESVLTKKSSQKSENLENSSTDASIEKGTLEEKADKEQSEKLRRSLSNSPEDIKKSMDSICTTDSLNDKKPLTQSGEFLNDCVGKLEDCNSKEAKTQDERPKSSWLHKENNKRNDDEKGESKKKDDHNELPDEKSTDSNTHENGNKQEVVAVVHLQTHSSKEDLINEKEKDSPEKQSKDDDSDIEMIDESNELNKKLEDKNTTNKIDLKIDSKTDYDDNQKTDEKAASIDSPISPINKTFIVTPTPKDVIEKQMSHEAIIVDENEEEEEVGELVEVPSLAERRNQVNPTNVDITSANKSTFENGVSTPPSANSLSRRGSNVVHLFIKGD